MISTGFTDGEKPDKFTISIGLKACGGLRAIGYGKMVHGYVKKNEEIVLNMFVGATLIEMYSRFGNCVLGFVIRKGFDTYLPLVNALLNLYAKNRAAVEAIDIFKEMFDMGYEPNAVTIVSALQAYAIAWYYTLMSNIYVVDGKWGKMAKLRTLIKEKGLRKINGRSMVEVEAKIHSFVAYERLHPKCEHIYELLSALEVEMREEGYTPDVECPF
ncbi:putative pentatricopeptide repeat-containing protein [Tripterygium wilfordii]|uniref:Putative pentatricopeptide repeat-containing protein n=1 Tax=Tripterygium wilfordii TaxID=458696 RepID=A0A7J7CZS7_TRIWF|nr:putative pentatricopeptide repeat-containing protein [Tripterygium wilfordii]